MRFVYFLLLLSGPLPVTTFAQKTIRVERRPNIELINVLAVQNWPTLLQDVAIDPNLNAGSTLMQRAHRQFAAVRRQPIFRTYQRLEDSLGTGTYLLGLYYADVPNARRIADLPTVITRAISPNHDSVQREIDQFFSLLNQLYRDVQFGRYLAENEGIYRQAQAEVRRNLPDTAFIPALERYYGGSKRGYYVVVVPFFKAEWGMGWEVAGRRSDGSRSNDSRSDGSRSEDVYNIVAPFGPAVVDRRGRVTSPGFDNRDAIRRWSVHEFGHSFVNPLAYQPDNRAKIDAFSHLYAPIRGDEQYDNWHTQFCEYVVRAGEMRIAKRAGNQTDANWVAQQNANWRYLPHFVAQLERYEQHRDRYATFTEFMPDLIASLAAIRP